MNERAKKEKYIKSLDYYAYSGAHADSVLRWWRIETESLKRVRDRGKPSDSQMSSRLLNFVSILCYEQGTSSYRQKNYQQASAWFEICTISDSENPNTWYNLSRSFAGLERKSEAVEALEKAIQLGWNNLEATEADPVFNNIRNNKKYKEILLKIK